MFMWITDQPLASHCLQDSAVQLAKQFLPLDEVVACIAVLICHRTSVSDGGAHGNAFAASYMTQQEAHTSFPAGKTPRHKKFDPKPLEAAFSTVFSNFNKCRPAQLMCSYPRGSKLGRRGSRDKFGDSRTNRAPDIQAAHFVMDDERQSRAKVNTYCRTPLDVFLKIQLLAAAYLLPTFWCLPFYPCAWFVLQTVYDNGNF